MQCHGLCHVAGTTCLSFGAIKVLAHVYAPGQFVLAD